MRRRPRTLALGALGTWLAAPPRAGGLVTIGVVIAAVSVMATVLAALALRDSEDGGAEALPAVAANAIVWGAGIMIAFGAGMRAIRLDCDQGILALARVRGASAGAYAGGRVLGLCAMLAAVVGGATFTASLTSLAAAGSSASQWRAIAGAVAYALAFAGTLGPLALATLGGKTRAVGYLALVLVLFVPELFSSWTSSLLPEGWTELTSIPAALTAIRVSIAAGDAIAPLVRAVAGLGLVALLSFLIVVGHFRRAEREAHP